MGKKNKGANKLAKMSDEERLRYLQARADVEEEARRRKQQLIALYMKNKLKREDAFTRLNVAKINQEWRSILRQLKCDELRSEIRCAEGLCKLSIDRKNQIVQRLLSDLEDSEELYSKNLQSHTENVRKLTTIHEERLKFWSDFYVHEKAILLKEFRDDVKLNSQSFEESRNELECVYFAIDEEIGLTQTKNQNKAQKRLDEVHDMMTIRLEYVTKSREDVMEALWREFQMVLNGYTSYTSDFYEDYLELRRRDEIETQVSVNHYREIAKCTDTITDLRLEINSKLKRHQMNKAHFLEVKKELQTEYLKLKSSLIQGRYVDKTKIRELVTGADKAKKVLERLKQKATSLVQLSAICRKYELSTQNLSLPQRSVMESSVRLAEEQSNFKMVTYKNFEQLGQFWDRYNKVRLDCACLIEEKAALVQENNQLKMRLKNYLVDISMQSSGSTAGNNALRLGQRPKSMTIEKVECIEVGRTSNTAASRKYCRPVTCIEGNLSVAIRSQKLLKGLENV